MLSYKNDQIYRKTEKKLNEFLYIYHLYSNINLLYHIGIMVSTPKFSHQSILYFLYISKLIMTLQARWTSFTGTCTKRETNKANEIAVSWHWRSGNEGQYTLPKFTALRTFQAMVQRVRAKSFTGALSRGHWGEHLGSQPRWIPWKAEVTKVHSGRNRYPESSRSVINWIST